MIEGITDRQSLFDYVARHLLRQNARSLSNASENRNDNHCVYRSFNGLKCAAGCLIDDSLYTADLECRSILEKPVKDAIEASIGRKIDGKIFGGDPECGTEMDLVCQLQKLHDHNPPEMWKDKLRALATRFKLELIPELQESAA